MSQQVTPGTKTKRTPAKKAVEPSEKPRLHARTTTEPEVRRVNAQSMEALRKLVKQQCSGRRTWEKLTFTSPVTLDWMYVATKHEVRRIGLKSTGGPSFSRTSIEIDRNPSDDEKGLNVPAGTVADVCHGSEKSWIVIPDFNWNGVVADLTVTSRGVLHHVSKYGPGTI